MLPVSSDTFGSPVVTVASHRHSTRNDLTANRSLASGIQPKRQECRFSRDGAPRSGTYSDAHDLLPSRPRADDSHRFFALDSAPVLLHSGITSHPALFAGPVKLMFAGRPCSGLAKFLTPLISTENLSPRRPALRG